MRDGTMNNVSRQKITILLADDHPFTQRGIKASLAQCSDIEVVGEASNGIDVQYMVSTLYPRVVLLDLEMPDLAPALFARWVREFHPDTIILILTFHTRNTAHLACMMDAGVAGYLYKGISAAELTDCIRRANNGEILFSREQLINVNEWRRDVGDKIRQLTSQEMEILKLLATGKTNEKIAQTRNLTVKAITYHITNIFSKLQINSRVEATIWALENLSDNLDLNPYLGDKKN